MLRARRYKRVSMAGTVERMRVARKPQAAQFAASRRAARTWLRRAEARHTLGAQRSHCCAVGIMQCTPTNMSWRSAIVDDACVALQADT